MNILTRRSLLSSSAAMIALTGAKSRAMAAAAREVGLKDYFRDDFRIGTAIGGRLMKMMPSFYEQLVATEFNALTMENDMKWEMVHPEPDTWSWEVADKFVEFGLKHQMYLVGHVLVWHSQTPEWVFKENDKWLSKEALQARMKSHIETVAGRYQGKMDAWDVVNEAVDEGKGWRKSPWYKIIGKEFMEDAFNYAHEVDPDAHLLYNDYNMHSPEKRAFVADFVRRFNRKGIPIHGIGMQGHIGLDFPEIEEFEKSIETYAKLGMRVHITELDLDVLPVAWDHIGAEISTEFEYSDELNPYAKGLPAEVEQQFTERYVEFFKMFLKHRDKIERVTFWGTSDLENWKNDFPVKGRTNYPMLFDRAFNRKPAYDAVVELTRQR